MDKQPKTFKNLAGIRITKCVCSSDGEPIKGTERECVILFNRDHNRAVYDRI